jgi:multidrug efflux pump subunit AcrB
MCWPDKNQVLREKLPAAFPGSTFSFLPADIVTQILNFGSPVPLDVQIAGADLKASRAFANKLLAKIRYVPGVADPRIQEQFQNPALKVDFNRELAGVVGLTEGDAATSIQATLSGSTQTAPTYWLNPANGVSYPVSVQTPQYGIDTLGELKNLPLTAAQSTQLLGGLATFSPEPLDAVVSHYLIRLVVNIDATTQQRDLGSVALEVEKIVAVKMGDVLVTISAPDLDQQLEQAKVQVVQLQANVEQAQANSDLSQVTNGRTARLVVQGWATQGQGDTDRLTFASRNAALAVAKANVMAQQAAVSRLQELTSFED